MASEVLATAGAVKIIITGEGANFSAVVADANRQLDKLGLKAKQSSSHMVTGTQAASASIRVLEGNINNNVRAAERFVANVLRLGPALQAAFPVVGAIALGAVIARLGKELMEFVEHEQQAGAVADAAWRQVGGALQLTNDELRVANDKLENSIAALEHKPRNGLKEALDEAAVSADRLSQKLEEDVNRSQKTFELSYTGIIENLFGTAKTGDLEGKWNSIKEQIIQARTLANEQIYSARGSGDKQAVDAALQKLNTTLQRLYAEGAKIASDAYRNASIAQQANADNAAGKPVPQSYIQGFNSQDMSRRIRLSSEMLSFFTEESDYLPLIGQNDTLAKKQGALQSARQADRDRMQLWQQELQAEKAQHAVNLDTEAAFWQKKADSVKKGSDLYNAALMEANKARGQAQQQMIKDFVSASIQEQQQSKTTGDQITEAITQQFLDGMRREDAAAQKQQQDTVRAFEESVQARRAVEAVTEESIRQAIQGGDISRLEGALELQALHQRTFADWSRDSAALSARYPDVPVPGAAQMVREYGVQSQRDTSAVEDATAMGALRDSARQLSNYFTDMPMQIGGAFQRTLSDLNDHMVAALSGQRGVNFSDVGIGLAQSVERMVFQHIEGSILKSILGHDPTAKLGSRGNPMYVRSADATAAAGSGASSILGSFLGDSSSAASGAGAGVGSVISGLLGGLSGFATGGAVPANLPVIVGERGPELFMSSTSGRIIPNHQLGTGSPSIHIDARGSTDPAATEMAVHRALAGYLPHLGSMAVAAMKDERRRTPQTRSRI